MTEDFESISLDKQCAECPFVLGLKAAEAVVLTDQSVADDIKDLFVLSRGSAMRRVLESVTRTCAGPIDDQEKSCSRETAIELAYQLYSNEVRPQVSGLETKRGDVVFKLSRIGGESYDFAIDRNEFANNPGLSSTILGVIAEAAGLVVDRSDE